MYVHLYIVPTFANKPLKAWASWNLSLLTPFFFPSFAFSNRLTICCFLSFYAPPKSPPLLVSLFCLEENAEPSEAFHVVQAACDLNCTAEGIRRRSPLDLWTALMKGLSSQCCGVLYVSKWRLGKAMKMLNFYQTMWETQLSPFISLRTISHTHMTVYSCYNSEVRSKTVIITEVVIITDGPRRN